MAIPDEAELLSLVQEPFRLACDNPNSLQVSWSLHLTPPLPASWPEPEGAIVFAYASALPMFVRNGVPVLTAMDAALTSPPFAAVLLRDGQPPEICVLATSLQSAGMQGVRPSNPREAMLWKLRDEIDAEIYRAPTRYSDLAREFYLQWGNSNGVLVSCLPPAQQRFLAELRTEVD
jgi:hypothetical protein